jgi:membrane-associated phospholipid phosphatase
MLLVLFTVCPASAQIEEQPSDQAQSGNSSSSAAEPPDSPKYLLKHIGQDQVAIWTSPFRAKISDLKWLVPVAGITTGLIVTDPTASREARRLTTFNSSQFSNVVLAAQAGTVAGLWALGWRNGDRQLRETGALAGEAMVNSLAVGEVLKYVFQRQRPTEDNGAGHFFQSGSQLSFPSNHAIVSFAFASVVAHEYNGWLSQALAYGSATAISLARVTGGNHFPSDVFVGGTMGYLIGRYVYRAHHDPALDQANYGTFVHEQPKPVTLSSAGSTYVQLDSWIYPALDRLIGLNVIRTPFRGLRPWTRTAIAQMLAQADPSLEPNSDPSGQVAALYSALKTEFAQELVLVNEGSVNESIRLESVYGGIYPIAGTPLNDSFHFGQTIVNNYGRPYWQGFNTASGFTSRAEFGRFFFYARGEYQRSPGAPAYSASVVNTLEQIDQNCRFNFNPVRPPALPCPQPTNPSPAASQFRLLDTYAGVTVLGNEISVGKQSLWWGPGEGGAMIYSDNAEPIYMLRINRTIPLRIPLLSKLLGPLRYDNFFGKLSQHNFPPDPFMYGNKISFEPTPNLELGFSRTAVFAGEGHAPLTFGEFWHSFTSTSDVSQTEKFSGRDPGARHGSFDFSYKVPFLRKWLTVYSDSVAHDEPSPLAAPRRAAIVPGIYLSHFPKISRLDLRVESGYTDIPTVGIPSQQGGHFLYWEFVYHDAYTNKGNLLGSWIGRDGKGTQVWTNYWLGPSSYVQLSYRHAQLSPQFINAYAPNSQGLPPTSPGTPSILGGATQSDFGAGARLRVRPQLELSTIFQYELWNVPLLALNQKSDFLTSVQLTFWPKNLVKRKAN